MTWTLITGATSGIGLDIAKKLSEDHNLLICMRDVSKRETLIKQLHSGSEYLFWDVDLENVAEIESSLLKIMESKNIQLDYFVHAAAALKMLPIKRENLANITRIFNTNLISVFLILKVLLSKQHNLSKLKSSVFISSNASQFGARGLSTYIATKSGLDGLMKTMAVEHGSQCRFNSVLPGALKTRMTEAIFNDQQTLIRLLENYPIKNGTIGDITNAVQFLLSEDSRWINGHQLVIDGGRSINMST